MFDFLHQDLARFDTPPKLIVYDNACKLHLYCLNHERALHHLFVDRFRGEDMWDAAKVTHWKATSG